MLPIRQFRFRLLPICINLEVKDVSELVADALEPSAAQ